MVVVTESAAAKLRTRPMKVGVAGLGAGAIQVVAAMEDAPYVDLVAAADIRPRALEAFAQRYGGRGYGSVEELANDPDVECIWISTPNQLHCEHALTAARGGKHIVVEKPMAVTLQQAAQMVEEADRNNVKLLCGHTASLMAGFRAMRRVITSGELGRPMAINCWSYVDWLFRPRMAPEIDISIGGGVPYRQGPHQFDVVRLMGGGMVKSVRGAVRDWMPFRGNTPGYYTAFLEFEDGLPATVVKNAYGYFHTTELVPWAGSIEIPEANRLLRKALRNGEQVDESERKEAIRFGSGREARLVQDRDRPARTGFQQDAGLVIVSCEKGDIRQSANGLTIYDDEGHHEVPVEGVHDERMAELDEMYDAIAENRNVHHDGRWGMATLEIILAMMESSKEGREIKLSHQCPAWE
ncbi:MAG TPA: Gfo/Idh/MocA family oxidoreductase [Chloroflexota bacterium]|nr:Gfo/Idh/MocA family oxidoreductase [Chloroflexota bacterium]